MNERTRKGLIYLTLPAAIIWGVYNFSDRQRVDTDAAKAPETMQRPQPTASAQTTAKMANIEQKLQATWGNDPFRVKASPKTQSPDRVPQWRLSGIVYSNETPLAIINNKPVGIGDVIDDAKVITIDAKAVTLEHSGSRVTLTVSKG